MYRFEQLTGVLAGILLSAHFGYSQSAAGLPAFEAASIKANDGCSGSKRNVGRGRMNLECYSVRSLIESAYILAGNGVEINLVRRPILGGPNWIDADRYDIHATAGPEVTQVQMMGPMLQTLLEQRFRLSISRGSQEIPVYFLTAAKSGVKFHEAKKGGCTPVDFKHPSNVQLPANACGPEKNGRNGTLITMGAHEMPLSYLIAAQLSTWVDRTIIDQTQLDGVFNYHLEFSSDRLPWSDGPSIFEALDKQLGLKLVPGKAPVEVIVVDRVERPSEN